LTTFYENDVPKFILTLIEDQLLVGWLFGMHANIDVWWSRATMAYFFGMYVNGIAVYGRDPLLTCEYAFFVSKDQGCQETSEDRIGTVGIADAPTSLLHTILFVIANDDLRPWDWRNCSSKGYHP
jgi:hypothetical protein